ncbi:MAG: hypothetical protein HKP52_10030 [Desulfofustis sp.]|nr:hypothetical protein [Desulfofustis sp.]
MIPPEIVATDQRAVTNRETAQIISKLYSQKVTTKPNKYMAINDYLESDINRLQLGVWNVGG